MIYATKSNRKIMESFQRLDEGVDLEDVPLAGIAHTNRTRSMPMWIQIIIVFVCAIITTIVLSIVCDEATTYAAWTIIIGFIGLLCKIISCLGDTKKMKDVANIIGTFGLLTCILNLISLYVLLYSRK